MNRYDFSNIEVGYEGEKEEVWVKKLRHILETDIHDDPLGCKISDTHVKVSSVHLGEFYEAQILFSHRYWISKFSDWLAKKIDVIETEGDAKIVIVGFENYFEPVLYALQQKLSSKKIFKRYLIYEESKYIGIGKKTDVKIRNIDELIYSLKEKQIMRENLYFVFLCGISTTLATFGKMREHVKKEINKHISSEDSDADKYEINRYNNISLIQVSPNKITEKNGSSKPEAVNCCNLIWEVEEKKKIVHNLDNNIKVEYLIKMDCEGQNASDCKWCFPEDSKNERPIIEVSDTSIVPIQMIQKIRQNNGTSDTEDTDSVFDDVLFEKKDGSFVYKDYLYYNHIERDEHHYLYYIRTAHLCAELYDRHRDLFDKWAENVKQKLQIKEDDKTVHVLIYPRHFSNGMFPQIINQYIFGAKAHLISIDVNKEFRSNFSAKYSNYSYFFNQIKNTIDNRVSINFYYVDDQLITGSTFGRTKSLIRTLMKESITNVSGSVDEKVKIFNGIFIFFNRLSRDSRRNYIEDPNSRFFALINICIPSVRNYGDSCPMCKTIEDSVKYQKASALDGVACHWGEKQFYHRKKSLYEVQDEIKKEKQSEKIQHDKNQERRFIRFYCENLIWKGIKNSDKVQLKRLNDCKSEEDFLLYFFEVMRETLENEENENKVDYFISMIKAISRPFVYYKENAKKATLKILKYFADAIILAKISTSKKAKELKIDVDFGQLYSKLDPKKVKTRKRFFIPLKNNYEIYISIVILINCLASIDSTYILSIENILRIYNKVLELQQWGTIEIIKTNGGEDNQGRISEMKLCCFLDEYSEKMVWKSDNNENYLVPSFYSVILNAYKRTISGISGKEKCKRFEMQSIDFMKKNKPVRDGLKLLWEEDKDSQNKEENLKAWLSLTLIKSMFLESVYEDGENKDGFATDKKINSDIPKQDVLKKYHDILADIEKIDIEDTKKENNTDKIETKKRKKIGSIGLWYYNSGLDDVSTSNDLFLIGKTSEEVFNDEKSSLKELLGFGEEGDENQLREIVNKNGYYEKNDVMIFKLAHYNVGDFYPEERNRKFENNEFVYLSIKLKLDGNNEPNERTQSEPETEQILRSIREIMKHRYFLTEMIRKDIDNGAIKSAIQAKRANRFLGSNKNKSHNKDHDIETIYYYILSNWGKLWNGEAQVEALSIRIKTYEMINVIWGLLISSCGRVSILKNTFGVEAGEHKHSGLNKIYISSKDAFNEYDKIITQYLKDISNDSEKIPHYIQKIIEKYTLEGYKSNLQRVCVEIKEFDHSLLRILPIFSSCQKPWNSGKPTDKCGVAVLFIGLIDLFLRNAIKHNLSSKELNIKLLIEGNTQSYIKKFVNSCSNTRNKIDDYSMTKTVLEQVLLPFEESYYIISLKKNKDELDKEFFLSQLKIINKGEVK